MLIQFVFIGHPHFQRPLSGRLRPEWIHCVRHWRISRGTWTHSFIMLGRILLKTYCMNIILIDFFSTGLKHLRRSHPCWSHTEWGGRRLHCAENRGSWLLRRLHEERHHHTAVSWRVSVQTRQLVEFLEAKFHTNSLHSQVWRRVFCVLHFCWWRWVGLLV